MGERRSVSDGQGPVPWAWAISALRSIVWSGLFGLVICSYGLWSHLRFMLSSEVLSANTSAFSVFAGDKSEVRENCDPHEVVEFFSLG